MSLGKETETPEFKKTTGELKEGNTMGMYDALQLFLASSELHSIRITFSEIERILGRTLPRSAYTYHAWWANGGHSHATAWLDAGYKVSDADLSGCIVTFSKTSNDTKSTALVSKPPASAPAKGAKPFPAASCNNGTMKVCGYVFTYIQDLIPECDSDGNAVKCYPQSGYDNKDGLALLYHGKGAFCRFHIEAENWPGVYLWVVDGQIIYIGETADLKRRFNTGYGNISPRNCYAGGQSTNCKMNKVVLCNFEKGRKISLYFYQTQDYKRVELDLLNKISTQYNVKDN